MWMDCLYVLSGTMPLEMKAIKHTQSFTALTSFSIKYIIYELLCNDANDDVDFYTLGGKHGHDKTEGKTSLAELFPSTTKAQVS